MPDPDSRKWIIILATFCTFVFVVIDALIKVQPVSWSKRAQSLLNNTVKQCHATRTRGLDVSPLNDAEDFENFHQVIFMNRPGVSGDCSFAVKPLDYSWWHPARLNKKRWRPESETWFATEASYGGDVLFNKTCGDDLKPGCNYRRQW